MHLIEQGKVNMLNRNFGVQVFGKAFGYLPGNPVLSKGGLDKNPGGYNEEQQRPEKPEQYFFKSLQPQRIVV